MRGKEIAVLADEMLEEVQNFRDEGVPVLSSVNAVADKLICLHRAKFGESLTNMKLQKLCYYAQGLFLAEQGNPLFPEDFQAWNYGPVCPSLYQRFRRFEWRQIDDAITELDLTPELTDHLEGIIES